jgi:hypothetical protein
MDKENKQEQPSVDKVWLIELFPATDKEPSVFKLPLIDMADPIKVNAKVEKPLVIISYPADTALLVREDATLKLLVILTEFEILKLEEISMFSDIDVTSKTVTSPDTDIKLPMNKS